jgi:alpha-ketoglutarate-dependent taurine dioxygenase
MAARNVEAQAVTDYIETSMRTTCRINWTDHRMAILDNWSVMHGRDALRGTPGIGLYRFAVWGNNDLDN